MLSFLTAQLLFAAPTINLANMQIGETRGANPFELFSGSTISLTELKLEFATPVELTGLRVTLCAPSNTQLSVTFGRTEAEAPASRTRTKTLVARFDEPTSANQLTATLESPADAGEHTTCVERIELLGQGYRPLDVHLPAREVAIAAELAACERAHPVGRVGEPIRCTLETPEFTIPGLDVVRVVAESRSDGEGSFQFREYFAIEGTRTRSLLKLHSEYSGDGPGSAHDETLTLCRARAHGVQTFDVHTSDGSSDLDEQGNFTSTSTENFEHFVWNGSSFDSTSSKKPCTPPLVPKRPLWLQSATATSTLREATLATDFYNPTAAADGLLETTWAEGVKGPGVGEALTLTFTTPLSLKAVQIAAGCGVNAKLWKLNERLKTLTLTFSDGTAQTFELADSSFNQKQRLELQRTAPTSSLTFSVGAVFPAKFQDACISEVELEPRAK